MAGWKCGTPVRCCFAPSFSAGSDFQICQKKNEGASKSSLAAGFLMRYQESLSPSSSVRLPPLKMNLFRNCGEVTKM
jgi:hypothetical protein